MVPSTQPLPPDSPGPTAPVVRVLTGVEQLRPLAAIWTDLVQRSGANPVFMGFQWAMTWLELRPDCELLVLVCEQDGQTIGIAPLYKSTLRLFGVLPRSTLRIIGDQDSGAEYFDLLLDPNHGQAAITAMAAALASRADWTWIWLPQIAEQHGACDRVRRLLAALDTLQVAKDTSFYQRQLPDTEEACWQQLSTKLRNNIRRYRKRLGADGEIQTIDLLATSTPEQAMQQLFDLHRQRWQASGQAGAFQRKPMFKAFTERYVEQTVQSGRVVLVGVVQADTLIAVRFGYRHGSNVHEVQTGYLPEKSGAGTLSVYLSLVQAISQGVSNYDFMAGTPAYKLQFGARAQAGRHFFAGRRNNLLNRLLFRHGVSPKGRYIKGA